MVYAMMVTILRFVIWLLVARLFMVNVGHFVVYDNIDCNKFGENWFISMAVSGKNFMVSWHGLGTGYDQAFFASLYTP